VAITHSKVSGVADGGDATLVRPSDWNANHAGTADPTAHGIAAHTAHANWKVLYTDGSGDEQELALGADGTVLTSTGAAGVPAFEALDTHKHQLSGIAPTLAVAPAMASQIWMPVRNEITRTYNHIAIEYMEAVTAANYWTFYKRTSAAAPSETVLGSITVGAGARAASATVTAFTLAAGESVRVEHNTNGGATPGDVTGTQCAAIVREA